MLDLGIHNLTYLLAAIVVYLVLAFLLRRPVDPLLLIPVCIGALLPDLDSQTSLPGRLLPSISRPLETRLGHLGPWHTPLAAAVVAVLAAPLIPLIGIEAWYLLPIGFLAHLFADLFRPHGVMVFWPVSQTRHCLFGGPVKAQGGPAERWLAAALAITAIVLLPMVDARKPLPAPSPSFEQTLARYYGLRGRNLVFASVQGTWQATGRRIGARFEILNAAGESFVMLDRFSGTVFTAGRDAADNLYINQINLQPGPAAEIKAVELHLEDEPLLAALPTVYQMQREPGLQHIFVSGDLVVPDSQDIAEPRLSIDYAQTSLRKIQSPAPGHYTLRYLTAAELIGLASLRVESADLVIVATSAGADDGATPTPLPSPSP
jgi:inner membrane protein